MYGEKVRLVTEVICYHIKVFDDGTGASYFLHSTINGTCNPVDPIYVDGAWCWSYGWRRAHPFKTKEEAVKLLGTNLPSLNPASEGLRIPTWADVVCSDDFLFEEVLES